MRVSIILASAVVAGALCSCTPIQVHYTTAQPMLSQVLIYGERACNDFTTSDTTFTFACPNNLPTSAKSGWVLTPLNRLDIRPTPPHDASWFNDAVGLAVTTPSLSSLEITYNGGQPLNLVKHPSVPLGVKDYPPPLPGKDVWVDSTDDGTTKTWTITLAANQCYDSFDLSFVSVAPDGSSRSDPLDVVILRRPQETNCGGGVVVGTGVLRGSGGNPSGGHAGPPTCDNSTFYFCTACGQVPQKVKALACTLRAAEVLLGYIDNATGQPLPTGCTFTPIGANDPC